MTKISKLTSNVLNTKGTNAKKNKSIKLCSTLLIDLKAKICEESMHWCSLFYFVCLIQRIMDEYEQDLRVLEEKHQQGLYPYMPC